MEADAIRQILPEVTSEAGLAAASDSALSSAGVSPAVAGASSPAPTVNRQAHDLRPTPLPSGF